MFSLSSLSLLFAVVSLQLSYAFLVWASVAQPDVLDPLAALPPVGEFTTPDGWTVPVSWDWLFSGSLIDELDFVEFYPWFLGL